MRLNLFVRLPLLSILLAGLVRTQPSGGPYGPIDRHYEIPKAGTVYYVAPDGKSDGHLAQLYPPPAQRYNRECRPT